MIGTLRKHSKWLWGIIITATIVSFVFWGSQSSRSGDRELRINRGKIDGKPVTEKAYREAEREVSIYFFLNFQDWPDRNAKKVDFDLQSATYQQLLLIQRLKDYGIQVDSAAVGQAVGDLLRNFGQNRGQKLTLDEFVQGALLPHANAEDLQRYFEHHLGVNQLREVIGLGGQLVTPDQVRVLYLRDNQELATDAVFFSSSNYVAAVPAPKPEAIAQYFELHQADYRVPDRVQVSYVRLDATNFLAEADRQMLAEITNVNNRIEVVYRQRTNSMHDVLGPEVEKAKIREQMRSELALVAGHRIAGTILDELLSQETVRPENLVTMIQTNALAVTNGLKVKVSAPFDEENGPTEFDGGPNFAKASFMLSASDPFVQQPLVSTNAIYLVAFNRKIPSEIPSLDQLRARVTADYLTNEARLMARRAGLQFAQAATNGLAQGKTFVGICADAKVKRVSIPPFSIATRSLPALEDRLTLDQYKRIAFTAAIGKTSEFQPTLDGGVVVYVQERLPVNEAKMKAEMPEFVQFVRQRRMQEAFLVWFERELKKALRDVPATDRKS
jgi:hypothetical protein